MLPLSVFAVVGFAVIFVLFNRDQQFSFEREHALQVIINMSSSYESRKSYFFRLCFENVLNRIAIQEDAKLKPKAVAFLKLSRQNYSTYWPKVNIK